LRLTPCKTYTYNKYAAFFEITQALILNFLQSRLIATFYECINIWDALTKEAHQKRHSSEEFVAAAFKRCASFVNTSYAAYTILKHPSP